MRLEARSEADEQAEASRLASTIANFPGQRFAVVDGGLIQNLPAHFERERLFARSLFLSNADVNVQSAGPWLVALDQSPHATEQVLALPATKPAMTFWSCGAGEIVLFRHLRTLNMARIPDWAADGGAHVPKPNAPPRYETVFFRHWDPRVLGALLPVLNPAQFKRILGPAEEIAFDASRGAGLRRVVADALWPPADAGLLLIRGDQFEAMIGRRMLASHRRIAAYLRRYATDRVAHMDDQALHELIGEHAMQIREHGVRHERSIGLWSYMQVMSTVDLGAQPAVTRFLTDPAVGPTADKRLDALFDERTRALRRAYG